YRYFYKRTKNLSREITKNNHQYDGIVIEAVNRFKYLKASGRNRDFTDRLIKVLNELIDNNIKVGTLGAKMGSMVEPMVVIVFSVVIGVYLLVFHAALSGILVILLLFYRAMSRIMKLQIDWNKFLGNMGSWENTRDYEKYLRKNKEK